MSRLTDSLSGSTFLSATCVSIERLAIQLDDARLENQALRDRFYTTLGFSQLEREFFRQARDAFRQVSLDEGGLGMDGASVAVVQVVKDDDAIALVDQFLGDDAADVASAAGDQDFHDEPPCAAVAGCLNGVGMMEGILQRSGLVANTPASPFELEREVKLQRSAAAIDRWQSSRALREREILTRSDGE